VRGGLINTGTRRPGIRPIACSGVADQLLTPGGATRCQVLVNKPTAGANARRPAGDLTAGNAPTLPDH